MSENRDDLDLLPLDFPEDNETEETIEDAIAKNTVKPSPEEKIQATSDEGDNVTPPLPAESENVEVKKKKVEKKSPKKEPEKLKTQPPPAKKDESKVLPIQGTFLPGQILQEGRVRADLSVEQVAQETKINKKYIISLEMGDGEHLPPGIYVEAYVKQLCKLYRLDPAHVINAMGIEGVAYEDKKVPGEILQDIENGKQVNFQEEVRVRKFFKIVGVILLLLTLSVWIIIKMNSKPTPPPTEEIVTAVEGDKLTEAVEAQPAKSISPEELEVFLAPQSFTMTELKVPK